ncbi:putative galactokinase [Ancylostoma duodenale]|uniref:Putative galactokinase n=1 Tax=Ancylostoma duodenale TaxID=51022 RepID=A0A0C2H686_9BILA|nr:putative galactokinase [Ancylostoma duodenale]
MVDTTKFQNVFGHLPTVRVFCPGRVNLIGEHIDYHGYGVLPMATEDGTEILAAPNGQSIIRIANVDHQYLEHTVPLPSDWSGASPPKWYDYVLCGWKGIMEKLNSDQIGFDLLVEVFRFREELADLCAIAEHYVGTQGGGMDQAAEVLAVDGGALRIDFSPLRSRVVTLPPLAAFTVLHCGDTLNKAATSQYNERVVEGRLAGKLLLKNSGTLAKPHSWRLKHVQEALGKSLEEMLQLCEDLPNETSREELENLLSKEVVDECLSPNTQHLTSFKLRPRARHVYSEALRVDKFEEACKAGELLEMGKLMYASHESCGKDYECSCKAMDKLVVECREAGAIGARLTGAGWGGCAVALVDSSHPTDLGEKLNTLLLWLPNFIRL